MGSATSAADGRIKPSQVGSSIAFGARADSRALVAVIFTTPTTRIARGAMLSVQRSAKLSADGGIAWPPRRGALPDGVLQALH